MKTFSKIIQFVIVMAMISGLVIYFEPDIRLAKNYLVRTISPCDQPLEYSLGDFDARFGLSRADFLKTIDQAAQIWQAPVNKKLFNYSVSGALPTGQAGLKINLIYDSRQASTDKLKTLGLSIHNDKAGYDTLKVKYDAFNKTYQSQKSELDNLISYFNQQKADYQAEVEAANKRGGATPEIFAILEQGRKDLNNLTDSIKAKQTAINKTIDDVNALAGAMNRLIRGLNLTVGNYNTIGAGASGEFQEGQYVQDKAGERIDVFQFDDREALVRVLAHELGHALGLEHLDNPQAIMYRLNESGNEKITADDLAELKMVCKIK